MANLVLNVCHMLGVEVNEEFVITYKNEKRDVNPRWSIDENGVVLVNVDGKKSVARIQLTDLLCGDVYIVKLPWKPKIGESYYSIYTKTSNNFLYVDVCEWSNNSTDLAKYKAGWVFKTSKEVHDAIPRIAEEFNLGYQED